MTRIPKKRGITRAKEDKSLALRQHFSTKAEWKLWATSPSSWRHFIPLYIAQSGVKAGKLGLVRHEHREWAEDGWSTCRA